MNSVAPVDANAPENKDVTMAAEALSHSGASVVKSSAYVISFVAGAGFLLL
jgi:hypothetical protein